MLQETKDKQERRLKKVKIGLMRNPKFALWSGIMMVGKTAISETFSTACTDGRNELYGREFIETLDDKELGFVILHENLHKAFKHLTTWKKLHDEDARLANAACDYVINLMLVEMDPNEVFIAMPRRNGKQIGLLDQRFKGMHTKQVFDILKQEQVEGGDFGDGDEGGFDEHDWEGAQKLSDEDKKVLEREIDQALRQGQIAHNKVVGAGGGGLNRELGDLLNPQVDWREVLREFVKSVCNKKEASSWRRVNRRYLATDTLMPTLIGESIGSIAIGVDTSGSIGVEELNEFLSEIKSICEDVNPNKLDLMYWDGEVAQHEVYEASDVTNVTSSTKPRGGGGTDPTCVIRYMKDKAIKPEVIVMFTDGCIDKWGDDWDAPILWVISNGAFASDVYAPVGKTIHIKH